MTVQAINDAAVRAGTRATADLPHSCGGCSNRWSGENTAHCGSGCHLTFTGLEAFDAHRSNGRCLTPAGAGLELAAGRAYQAWRVAR